MEHIGAHLNQSPRKKNRDTERGELMRYFQFELNKARVRDGLPPLSMPRMGKILELIPTKDLYYLKSVCDQTAARGGEFSKKFWWELKPKPDAAKPGRVPTKASGKNSDKEKPLPTGQAGSTKKLK